MTSYCLKCGAANEINAAEEKSSTKVCKTCKGTYKWPTGGYSYNVPPSNVNPNGIGVKDYPNLDDKIHPAPIPAGSH